MKNETLLETWEKAGPLDYVCIWSVVVFVPIIGIWWVKEGLMLMLRGQMVLGCFEWLQAGLLVGCGVWFLRWITGLIRRGVTM